MIVTIGGTPGSGKTTVARRAAERLGYELVCAGQLFRDQAEEAGVDLEEYGRRALEDDCIDRTLDLLVVETVLSFTSEEKSVVADGRLTGLMLQREGVPAFRVWIDADIAVRSERIAKRDGIEAEEAMRRIGKREDVERRRYSQIYGIDLDDLSAYDLVVDSSELTPREVLRKILDGLKERAGT